MTSTLSGDLAVGSGTLTGGGTVSGNATLAGGTISFTDPGNITGTLDVTGGNWNGQGSVTGPVTASSGTFTIGSGANLTATSGLSVTGGRLAGADGTATLTGSLNYTSSSNSNFAGVIANGASASTLTLNSSAATTLTLSARNTYSGPTQINGGTLRINGTTSGQGNFSFGTLSTSATLGGSGTIGLATTKTVNLTGVSGSLLAILNPGAGGTTATLTINGANSSANSLLFGANSQLLINTNGATADEVIVNGQVAGASNATLAFNQLAAPTASNYVLLTDTGSGLDSAFAVSGVPAGYQVVGNTTGSLAIDLTENATATISVTAPASGTRYLTGQTIGGGISGTVTNTAPAGSASLAINPPARRQFDGLELHRL